MLTGERSNSLKALIGIIIFISMIDYVKLKQKILIFISIFAIFFFAINFSDYLKFRYIDLIYSKIKLKDERKEFLDKSIYITLYKSGFYVFKNNPWFGVGNKNYRIETCDPKKNSIQKEYRCLTHPHQIYIEILSEHGIFGTGFFGQSLARMGHCLAVGNRRCRCRKIAVPLVQSSHAQIGQQNGNPAG